MRSAAFPVLVALAIIFLVPADMPSQAPSAPKERDSPDEIQQLKMQYIKLRTELKSRRMLKSIQEVDRDLDLKYLAKQYGIQRLPEFRNITDEHLVLMLREAAHDLSIRPLIYGTDDLKEIYREPPEHPATNVPFVTDENVLAASRSVVAIISRDSMVHEGDSWVLTTTPLTLLILA